MANTFTQVPGRVAGIGCKLGHCKIKITVAATTYTQSSGGLPVDFYQPFVDLGINRDDVQEIEGYTELGYLAVFTKGTFTDTTTPYTARLWSGITQHSNGACTQTLHCNIWFYPGSK
jgi:hypothetical protein